MIGWKWVPLIGETASNNWQQVPVEIKEKREEMRREKEKRRENLSEQNIN